MIEKEILKLDFVPDLEFFNTKEMLEFSELLKDNYEIDLSCNLIEETLILEYNFESLKVLINDITKIVFQDTYSNIPRVCFEVSAISGELEITFLDDNYKSFKIPNIVKWLN